MAGFRGPLFLLGLSAVGTQAGFRGPLPVPPLSATPVVITQAGFIGALPFVNLGAYTVIQDYTPEGGPSDGAVRQRLLDDDEVIIIVARAFLTMVH